MDKTQKREIMKWPMISTEGITERKTPYLLSGLSLAIFNEKIEVREDS